MGESGFQGGVGPAFQAHRIESGEGSGTLMILSGRETQDVKRKTLNWRGAPVHKYLSKGSSRVRDLGW